LKAARDTAAQAGFVLETIQPVKDAAYQRLLESAAEAKAAADKPDKRAAAERASEDFVKAKGNLEAAMAARDASARVVKELEALGPQNGEAKAATEKALADATARQKESGEANQKAEKELAEADKNLQKARTDQTKAQDNAQFAAKIAQKSDAALTAARAGLQSANEALKVAEAERGTAAKIEEEKRPKFRSAAFSPDNRSIVTIADGGGIQIWNADSAQAVEAVAADAAQDVMFVDAARVLVIGPKTVPWDIAPVWKFERAIGREDDSSPIQDRVLALAFSADAKLLASGGGQPSHDGEIKLWSPVDGSLIRAFTDPHSDTVYSLAFSPDQKRLASGAADKFAKVFEVESGRLVKSFEGHTHHVLGVSWKRDGRTLASAGADKVIKVWNALTGEQRKTLDGFGKEITSVQFLDASAEALVSTGDSQLRLIRDDGNNNVRSFEGATGFLTSAAATPDGKRVVAANQEGVLRVWDGATGKLVRSFEPPREEKLASRTP
jgi:WD domain, G-beta repeat